MKRFALFVFNGDPICFIHVLLNALDMKERGCEVKIIIEGAATKLIADLAKSENLMYGLWEKVKFFGLIDGVCRACSNKMGTLASAEEQGLALLGEMAGHPSMARYREDDFEIITF